MIECVRSCLMFDTRGLRNCQGSRYRVFEKLANRGVMDYTRSIDTYVLCVRIYLYVYVAHV